MKRITLSAMAIAIAMCASAEIKLPAYMTSNMVLQHDTELTIPGRATPSKKVSVTPSWAKPVTVKAGADGRFSVKINTPEVGGPYEITFTEEGGSPIELTNILSGEVWLCSGQSNMEFPVNGWTHAVNYEQELSNAHHPEIRLLQVRKNTSLKPVDPIDMPVNMGGWQECNSLTLPEFSAIAYFYARELSNELGVPVGVIDTTWGGTPAEAWTGYDYVQTIPGFESQLDMLVEGDFDQEKVQAIYDKKIQEWMSLANKDSAEFDKGQMQSGWKSVELPCLIDTQELPGFDGIIWMQRSFQVPQSWAGKEYTLHLAMIDDEDITYLNGEEVAHGSGYNVPRNYKVPASMAKAGDNVITVRVSDFGGEGGIYGEPSTLYAEGPNGEKISLAGDWNYLVAADFRTLPTKPVAVAGSSFPTVLYNAMLTPLKQMPVKGFLWYQGCANVGRDQQYGPLMQALVNNWRQDWGADLPFYFVQLAGYLNPNPCQPNSQWAALRQAQTAVLDLDNTGMATAIDLGDPGDIHPKNKQEVARRLSLISLTKDYGKDLTYLAPQCVSAKAQGDKVVLTLDAPAHATSAAVLGFIVGDKDGKYAQALAKISDDGKTITLSCPKIKYPTTVKYDWADYPNGNVYGATGLPMTPFVKTL